MRAEAAVQLGCFFGKVVKKPRLRGPRRRRYSRTGAYGFVLTFLPGPATLVRETPTRCAFMYVQFPLLIEVAHAPPVQIVVQLLTVLRELNPTCTRTRPWIPSGPHPLGPPRLPLPPARKKQAAHYTVLLTGFD